MSSYRFAFRPRWVLSHLLVIALVVVMINLGFWQLRRLDEKREYNSLVTSRSEQPVAPVADVVDPTTSFEVSDDVTYRRVTARGTYDDSHEVMVRSRSLHDRPGVWVLTPLVTDDGSALVVNRGWLPTQGVPEQVPGDAAAGAGEVTVSGLLLPTQERGSFGPTDPPEGTLISLARADLGRLQAQVPYDLFPVYLQLEEQEPSVDAEFPELLPEPDLTEGPHLSYAVQWFIFAAIAVVGYPLVLRRQARGRDDGPAAEDGDADDPDARGVPALSEPRARV